MRHNAIPLFCAAAGLLAGCVPRTVEIRPVAPVVESYAAPVAARAAADPAPGRSLPMSGNSDTARQDSGVDATVSGVQVEAVIPGVYSGRSLSFEKPEKLK